MARTRIGSFNVENMFDRPRAMNNADWDEGRPVLAAHARFNELAQLTVYDTDTKAEMLDLLEVMGLLRSDTSRFAILRKVRGRLLVRHRDGETTLVAAGRSDWVGWVELVTERVTELATTHTAMVVRDVGADVLGVLEAESRPLLELFSRAALAEVGSSPYDEALLIDGNDDRGIDVGLMCRDGHGVTYIRTHIFDADAEGRIFSRDCAEYHLLVPGGQRLVVLVNHLKSKGYGSPGDPVGAVRRARQAARVAEIYEGLRAEGIEHVAVVGDLNDWAGGGSLDALLEDTDLTDISEHPDFEWNGRRGTWGSGNEKDKIDYVLLSPALFALATGGGVYRKGVYRGPRTRAAWEVYDTLTRDVDQASDHAAIYADIEWP
ncbi:endonuclease/exonuclease/phosphatase family protein [Nocardioides currus]|uniref:endonuclease/exonuclease/phosphatase family protein n=1 Tax=Nocardioides currus TaxID=2133958 RepID=UPI001A9C99FC|nr:endonuclease/exonuclease/phosphatase family protein [Nocardioides currus]